MDVPVLGFTAAAGYRQNYADWFGIQARLGLSIGIVPYTEEQPPEDETRSEQDNSAMMELYGEFIPHFGPLGRFYFGPMVFVSRLMFTDNRLNAGESEYYLSDMTRVGGGLDMGVLVLSREQLDIKWRIKSALDMPLRLEFGAGYHFM